MEEVVDRKASILANSVAIYVVPRAITPATAQTSPHRKITTKEVIAVSTATIVTPVAGKAAVAAIPIRVEVAAACSTAHQPDAICKDETTLFPCFIQSSENTLGYVISEQ